MVVRMLQYNGKVALHLYRSTNWQKKPPMRKCWLYTMYRTNLTSKWKWHMYRRRLQLFLYFTFFFSASSSSQTMGIRRTCLPQYDAAFNSLYSFVGQKTLRTNSTNGNFCAFGRWLRIRERHHL